LQKRLKLRRKDHVHKDEGEGGREQKTRKGLFLGFFLAADFDGKAFGRGKGGEGAFDSGGGIAEVGGGGDVGSDVDGALQVFAADLDGAAFALDGGQRGKRHGRALAQRRPEKDVAHVEDFVAVAIGGADVDEVFVAGFGVAVADGLKLGVAGEGGEDGLRNLLFGKAQDAGFLAVYFDVELGVVFLAGELQVGEERPAFFIGKGAEFGHDLFAVQGTAFEVLADDFHVDRGRLADVEDALDDASDEEIGGDAGGFVAQGGAGTLDEFDIAFFAVFAGDKGDLDVAAVGAGVSGEQGGAASGKANVREGGDGFGRTLGVGFEDVLEDSLEPAGNLLGAFDSGADGGFVTEGELAFVGLGKELAAEAEVQRHGGRTETQNEQHSETAMAKDPGEGPFIGGIHAIQKGGEPTENAGRFGRGMGWPTEDAQTQKGCHGARNKEAHEKGKTDGEREGNEQKTRDALQKEDGEKHDYGGERRDQNGHGDFLGGQKNGLFAGLFVREMAVDVFKFDDGIIDQPADAEGKSSKGEDVEGLGGKVQKDKRRDDGQRNGDGDDAGGTQRQKKKQNDQDGQTAALQGLVFEGFDGIANVDGLIKGDDEFDAVGDTCEFGQQGTDGIDDGNGVGLGLFEDADIHASDAGDADDVGLIGCAIGDAGDIGQTNGLGQCEAGLASSGLAGRQDDLFEFLDGSNLGVGKHVEIAIAGFQIAAGQKQIGRTHGPNHVEHAQVAGAEGVSVHFDDKLALFASAGGGGRDAGDVLKLRFDDVVSEVVKLFFIEGIGGNSNGDDGNVGDVELEDEGLLNAGWKRVEDLGHALLDLELGVVEVCAVGKPGADDGDTLTGHAFDALHAWRSSDRAFDGNGDRFFNVGRTRTGIKRRDAHDRDGDVGEQVHRQAGQRLKTKHDGHEGQHQDQNGIAQSQTSEPHRTHLVAGMGRECQRTVITDRFVAFLARRRRLFLRLIRPVLP